MNKYSEVKKDADQARWAGSLADFVHPIDYSGGAVLVGLSGGHFLPQGGFQSELQLEALVIHGSEAVLLL